MATMRQVTIRNVFDEVETGNISLDVSIQRGDNKWTLLQKSKLVETIIKNYPVSPIFTAVFEGKSVVYDGLQRMTALKQFYNEKFALEGIDEDLCGKTFSQLDEDDKKKFLEYGLNVSDVGEVSGEELADLFLRLNNGSALTKTQKTRGYLGVTIAAWAKKMCEYSLFTKQAAFTSRQVKDDAAQECLIQGIILIHGCIGDELGKCYEWKNISRDEILRYSEEVLSKVSEKELKQYEEVIKYLDTIEVTNNYEKTFIPCLIVLGKYAMLSGVSKEEFSHYIEHLRNNLPKGYGIFKGAGSVTKAKTVGKIQVLVDNFNEKFPNVKKPVINLDISRKRNSKKSKKPVADVTSHDDSNSFSASGVEAQPQSDDVALEKSVEQSEAGAAPEDNIIQSETEISADTASPDTENVETSADTVVETEDYKNSDVVSVSSEADTDDSSDVSNRAETDVTEIEPIK